MEVLEGNSEESDVETQKENQTEGKKQLTELKLFSFKKKMQLEIQKKKNKTLAEAPQEDEKPDLNVHARLFGRNNKNTGS